jgi:hypothetical protein
MKIALTIDNLIERDHAIEVFELLCSLFEDAQIYTFVHLRGAILGPIEQKKISSTYLSSKVKNKKDFKRLSFLAPFAGLNIPCNYDLVINLSRGLSHGIPRCQGTRQITYLYDMASLDKTTFLGKIFNSFLKRWSLEKLNTCDELILSSSSLEKELGISNGSVIYPFIKIEDFSLITSSVFKHDFFVVSTEGLSLNKAKEIASFLKTKQIRFCFVGPDDHLKKDFDPSILMGVKCNGELAPLLASAKGLIHLGENIFPKIAISSMLVGRPVFCLENELNKEFLGKAIFFHDFSELLIDHNFDSQSLRASMMKYHPAGFKGQILKIIEKADHVQNHHPSPCC